MSLGVIEHEYIAFSLSSSFYPLEDIIFFFFFYPPRTFPQVNEIILHQVQENLLNIREQKKKTHITQEDPRFFQQKKDDNLIIVLTLRLGYVKRHKLVRSHLKSRSIVLPLTKPILSCIFDKIPTPPCLLRSFFFVVPELSVFSIVCVVDRKQLLKV